MSRDITDTRIAIELEKIRSAFVEITESGIRLSAFLKKRGRPFESRQYLTLSRDIEKLATNFAIILHKKLEAMENGTD